MHDSRGADSRFIVVEGPIGVGKTTLVRRLAERNGSRMLLEQPQDGLVAGFRVVGLEAREDLPQHPRADLGVGRAEQDPGQTEPHPAGLVQLAEPPPAQVARRLKPLLQLRAPDPGQAGKVPGLGVEHLRGRRRQLRNQQRCNRIRDVLS